MRDARTTQTCRSGKRWPRVRATRSRLQDSHCAPSGWRAISSWKFCTKERREKRCINFKSVLIHSLISVLFNIRLAMWAGITISVLHCYHFSSICSWKIINVKHFELVLQIMDTNFFPVSICPTWEKCHQALCVPNNNILALHPSIKIITMARPWLKIPLIPLSLGGWHTLTIPPSRSSLCSFRHSGGNMQSPNGELG